MFCSVPTAKSSQWLNRLRASRGFPESDHIDLDHFLSTINPSDSSLNHTTPLPAQNSDADRRHDNGALQGRDLINNVLSELFHMGEFQDKSRIKPKKSRRKQLCPKMCLVPSNSDAQNVTDRSNSVPLPLTLRSRQKAKKANQVSERVEEEEEEEKALWDLSAYSQTEVTVIDTSVPCWKFEKTLYRSKNVWKVGDKKGKGLMSSERKKRKDGMNENGGDVQKKKLKKKKLKLCNSSKYVDKEEAMVASKYSKGHDRDKMVASNQKKRDKCIRVQEKSSCKKQTDEGSTVILIKSIPTTNKKNVSNVSNSHVKSMQI